MCVRYSVITGSAILRCSATIPSGPAALSLFNNLMFSSCSLMLEPHTCMLLLLLKLSIYCSDIFSSIHDLNASLKCIFSDGFASELIYPCIQNLSCVTNNQFTSTRFLNYQGFSFPLNTTACPIRKTSATYYQ